MIQKFWILRKIHEFFLPCFLQVANLLIDPMVRGIYAGNVKQLSVKSCFRALYDLEQNHGSIVKGMFKQRFQKKNSKST